MIDDDYEVRVKEALALRARVAKLEAALWGARPYVQGVYDAAKYGDDAHMPKLVLDAIDAALLMQNPDAEKGEKP